MAEASILQGTVVFQWPRLSRFIYDTHLEPFGEVEQDEMVLQDPPSVNIALPP